MNNARKHVKIFITCQLPSRYTSCCTIKVSISSKELRVSKLETNHPSASNLTISFTPSAQSTCDGPDSLSAITFTTSSVPSQHECFNIEDIFSNSSSTFNSRNASTPYSSQTFTSISWGVSNAGAFDSSANYSRILYQQQNVTQPQEGQDAARLLEVFSGRDCIQTNSSGGALLPILGWSCQSAENGSCYQTNYPIQSFTVVSAAQVNGGSGKCWVASTGDAGQSLRSDSMLGWVGGALVLFAAALM